MSDLLTGVPPMPAVEREAKPWWAGRTFYACTLCNARDERLPGAPHPASLPCWGKTAAGATCPGTMEQWTPPGVERDRIRHG